mgnify:CR=1 FL=1
MPNPHYRKGYRLEKKTARILEAAGMYTVESRGSHGLFDVVGISRNGLVLVQVKSAGHPAGPAERQELAEFANCPPGTVKLIHTWRDRAREPEVREV